MKLLDAEEFRAQLLARGLLVDAGTPGVYHRSAAFESIVAGVGEYAHAEGADLLRRTHFLAPVVPIERFLPTDYLRSFPDLVGSIQVFSGGDQEHAALVGALDGGAARALDEGLHASELMLSSAVCHGLYPMLAGGVVGADEPVHECIGSAFRHEPSTDPARMQVFRMHEYVHVGTPESAVAHRDEWLRRGLRVLTDLGLDVRTEVANDPFFGRLGGLLADSQRSTAAKFEITAQVTKGNRTAISSANCHGDHFGHNFSISTPDGARAHSACFGFGLERIALALISEHGFDLQDWPDAVAGALWPDAARQPATLGEPW